MHADLAEQTISKPCSFISHHTHNTIHQITLSESEHYRTIPHNTATQDQTQSKIIHNTTPLPDGLASIGVGAQ